MSGKTCLRYVLSDFLLNVLVFMSILKYNEDEYILSNTLLEALEIKCRILSGVHSKNQEEYYAIYYSRGRTKRIRSRNAFLTGGSGFPGSV